MVIARILWIVLRVFGLGVIVRFLRTLHERITGGRPLPRFPPELVGDGPRTWVVFTVPDDAASARVLERIRTLDPTTTLHEVDLRREPVLTRGFRVRGAPSVFLVGPDGSVRARLGDGTGLGRYVSRGA